MGAISHSFKQDNPFKLYQKFDELFKKIRKNPMTHFVEVETFRYLEHCGPNDDTSLGYRKLQEVKKWKKKDPLAFSKNYLTRNKIFNKDQIDTLDKKINNNVDKDFNFLSKLKKPKFKDISKLVYKA